MPKRYIGRSETPTRFSIWDRYTHELAVRNERILRDLPLEEAFRLADELNNEDGDA
jgi:hypothetical protein